MDRCHEARVRKGYSNGRPSERGCQGSPVTRRISSRRGAKDLSELGCIEDGYAEEKFVDVYRHLLKEGIKVPGDRGRPYAINRTTGSPSSSMYFLQDFPVACYPSK
ncbi:hypothetical protein KM043_012042 [Ampulex compressa]|nr:hypothetical protein KM043_012042 [Ampulex compressa]